MVANYSEGKRRFDSYAAESVALEEASKLARRMSQRDVLAASITREEAIEFAAAKQALAQFNVPLGSAASTLAECLKKVGSLTAVLESVQFYAARHRQTTKKLVKDAVAELLAVKAGRGASIRYLQDLRYRLSRFSDSFSTDVGSISTAALQDWLDNQKLEPQGYTNYRRVLNLFFNHSVARGYASDNPVEGVERVQVRTGDIEIYAPGEMVRLLAASSPEFLPCLALGAFAGLRSAEIERMEWKDISLADRHIVVGASRSKTASRRVVPMSENLADWLAPYAGHEGLVWKAGHDAFYDGQKETAAATGTGGKKQVHWKTNGLRHSYASYRFAVIGDAGRVAGELGNSAGIVHRHYREIVTASAGKEWFSIRPDHSAGTIQACFGIQASA